MTVEVLLVQIESITKLTWYGHIIYYWQNRCVLFWGKKKGFPMRKRNTKKKNQFFSSCVLPGFSKPEGQSILRFSVDLGFFLRDLLEAIHSANH